MLSVPLFLCRDKLGRIFCIARPIRLEPHALLTPVVRKENAGLTGKCGSHRLSWREDRHCVKNVCADPVRSSIPARGRGARSSSDPRSREIPHSNYVLPRSACRSASRRPRRNACTPALRRNAVLQDAVGFCLMHGPRRDFCRPLEVAAYVARRACLSGCGLPEEARSAHRPRVVNRAPEPRGSVQPLDNERGRQERRMEEARVVRVADGEERTPMGCGG